MEYVKDGEDAADIFKIEVEDIFKVTRDEEDGRYNPFAYLDNRKLLSHGSRLMSFVSIFFGRIANRTC